MNSVYINSADKKVGHRHFNTEIEFIIAASHNYSTIRHATKDKEEVKTKAKNMLSSVGKEYLIMNSKEFLAGF